MIKKLREQGVTLTHNPNAAHVITLETKFRKNILDVSDLESVSKLLDRFLGSGEDIG